jgi:uncharacterized protein (DUF1786 family)
MRRFLLLDIGAGTMDVLYYDRETGLHYKAVAKSPVLYCAEKIEKIPGDLLVTGYEMGGGSISTVLKKRAREAEVVMSVSASATIHHNIERVRALGIKVVDDIKAEDLRYQQKYTAVSLSDLDIERIENIIKGLGVPFKFDVIGICAQDHGVPPEGVSHLDYRHRIFKAALDENPFPHSLIYRRKDIPANLNRLLSIAKKSEMLPADDVYILDSGMAAILGASLDARARLKEKVLVLDVATSHTVGAAVEKGEIAGFFEYHTHDITLERLEYLIKALAEGELNHEQILQEGGHGAYIRKSFGFHALEAIIVTGPKRKLVEHSQLSMDLGAPLGDNMMTGTVGLLEAIRRKKGMDPISYL